MRRPRRGAVLLEALVAMVILVTAGIWTVVMARGANDAIIRAKAADTDTRRASAFLEVVSLWPREDLDRHLGDRREGPWVMHVDRFVPTLYTVTVFDADTVWRPGDDSLLLPIRSGRELFRTTLYRAEALASR